MGKSKKTKADFLMEKIGSRIWVSFEPGAGNNSLIIKELIDGKISKKIVHNLASNNSKAYKVLGVAYGQNFMDCIYFGSKYAKNFERNVDGYILEHSDKMGHAMKVTFYTLKKKV